MTPAAGRCDRWTTTTGWPAGSREQRPRLRAVAYRMLGSLAEADDAVQDTWLRLSRAGAGEVENLGGWLTTVLARVCLNMLRSRTSRREEPSATASRPGHQPRRRPAAGAGGAAGRLGRARPAGRARHPVPGGAAGVRAPRHVRPALRGDRPRWSADPRRRPAAGQPGPPARPGRRAARSPDLDLARQREVVGAFFQAARGGDFDALVALLAPGVVLRSDFGGRRPGAPVVPAAPPPSPGRPCCRATRARLHPALVNGTAGVGHHRRRPALRGAGLHRHRGPDRRDRRHRRPGPGPQDRGHGAERGVAGPGRQQLILEVPVTGWVKVGWGVVQ